MKDTCIYIFTRDLRTTDNTSLEYCVKNYKKIIPVFFLTDTQINPFKNRYFSQNSVSFMVQALSNLRKKINLNIEIVNKDIGQDFLDDIIKKYSVESVVITKDYTPYSKKREQIYKTICDKNSINFYSFHDYLLLDEITLSPKGTPYRKFSPFYKKAMTISIRHPVYSDRKSNSSMFIKINKESEQIKFPEEIIDNDFLKKMSKLKDYEKERDLIFKNTTKLSRYIKYGIFSIRMIYDKFKYDKGFVRSLLWRDFYYSYYNQDPDALSHGDMNKNKVAWSSNKIHLEKWKKGETGFPLVDAAMRELVATGYIHNRGRLVVSSFLVKNLMISWKTGERFFAENLYDYDPIINCGNWSNVAAVAKHSSPYFRILNPWIQSKKFDPDCIYIKKWIPEISEIPSSDIHNWGENYKKYIKKTKYTRPIVDFKKTKELYLKFFK